MVALGFFNLFTQMRIFFWSFKAGREWHGIMVVREQTRWVDEVASVLQVDLNREVNSLFTLPFSVQCSMFNFNKP